MDRDGMFDRFLEDLDKVRDCVKFDKKEEAMKFAESLVTPLPQIADTELRSLVATLVRLIGIDDKINSLIIIDNIEAKVTGKNKGSRKEELLTA